MPLKCLPHHSEAELLIVETFHVYSPVSHRIWFLAIASLTALSGYFKSCLTKLIHRPLLELTKGGYFLFTSGPITNSAWDL